MQEKKSARFFPRPFRPCCQLSILRLGKFQCFKLSLFDYICVQANSRRSETVCKCRRVKITRGENNHVYRDFRFLKVWYYLYSCCTCIGCLYTDWQTPKGTRLMICITLAAYCLIISFISFDGVLYCHRSVAKVLGF